MFGASALAVDPPAGSPAKSSPNKAPAAKSSPKKPIPRETRMRVTGIVTEITADTIRIERAVTAELMDFTLEKSLDKIKAGDKVTISYIQKEDKNIALRVNKAVSQKKAITTKSGNVAPSSMPAPKP